MSLQDKASAAGINPYNGMSNDHAQAAMFQSLLDRQEAPTAPQAVPSPAAPAAPPDSKAPQALPSAHETPPEESGAGEAAEGAEEYQSLHDFLQAKGYDPESAYELSVPVKIDGKDGAVSLKDALKAYQLDAHITQKSQALADERRTWETQRQQAQQQQAQIIQQAQALVNLAHQQLMGDYGNVNWQQLAINDPASYQQHWPIYQQRAVAIQQALQQTQAASQQQALQQQQALAERLPKEQEMLFAARPTWRDPKTFDGVQKEILTHAQSMGLSQDEIRLMSYDHRFMELVYDAAQGRRLQSQAPQVLKKVRAAPQMAAPGARTISDPKTGQNNQLRELAFSPRGRKDDQVQAAYFGSLLERGA